VLKDATARGVAMAAVRLLFAVCCLCVSKNSTIQGAADILSQLEQTLEDSGDGGP
jgi:hypothetical protein